MLKKLVKYGNSNALILDKAILELLNIEEGSTIKIKTDGTSIIITPQKKVVSEKVHTPFTHDEATMETTAKTAFSQFKEIPANKYKALEKEFVEIMKKRQDLNMALFQNPNFMKEAKQAAEQLGASTSEYLEAYMALRAKFSPELLATEKELTAFTAKYNPSTNAAPSKEQLQKMMEAFASAHTKNKPIYHALGELSDNPEYQHEAQLIAEKYNNDKNSADYTRAINELKSKYVPEHRKAQEEINAVAQKSCGKVDGNK